MFPHEARWMHWCGWLRDGFSGHREVCQSSIPVAPVPQQTQSYGHAGSTNPWENIHGLWVCPFHIGDLQATPKKKHQLASEVSLFPILDWGQNTEKTARPLIMLSLQPPNGWIHGKIQPKPEVDITVGGGRGGEELGPPPSLLLVCRQQVFRPLAVTSPSLQPPQSASNFPMAYGHCPLSQPPVHGCLYR